MHTSILGRRIFVATIALLVCAIARSGNLTFLKDTAIAKFDDADIRLMTETATAVLNDAATPKNLSWKNAQTNNSGTAESLIEFTGPNLVRCKRLRIENRAGSQRGRATYTACNFDAEGWKLVPSDYAPLPKKK